MTAALNLAIEMAILLVIGFFARKKRLVDEKFSISLSSFIYNFVFPCSVVYSLQVSYDPSEVWKSGQLIGISIFTMALMLGVGLLFNRIGHRTDDMSRILLVNIIFTNFTYMAFPIMGALYQAQGSFYIAVYTIPVRVLFYIATPLIFTVGKESAARIGGRQIGRSILRTLLSPPVLAVPIGLALYIFGITLPVPVFEVVKYMSAVATPMGMVLVGVTLAAIPMTNMWKEKRLISVTVLRLLAAPAIMLGLYMLLSRLTYIDPVIAKVSILYCALPAAATTTILAIKSQGDANKAAQCVFVTTLFSIATVPMWYEILEIIVK